MKAPRFNYSRFGCLPNCGEPKDNGSRGHIQNKNGCTPVKGRHFQSMRQSTISALILIGDFFFEHKRVGWAESVYRIALLVCQQKEPNGIDAAILMKKISETSRAQSKAYQANVFSWRADTIANKQRTKLEQLFRQTSTT